MAKYLPTKLEQPDERTLRITWSDGRVDDLSVSRLRDVCPCTTCREKRSAAKPSDLLPVLKLEEAQPTRIAHMKAVGNYAYGIHFNDGHDTGIYTLEFLRGLGDT